MSELIKKINGYLTRSNLSKKELGKQIGVSEVTILNILNGKQSVKVDTLEKIAEALNVNTAYFFLNDTEIESFENMRGFVPAMQEAHNMVALMRFTNVEVFKKHLKIAKNDKQFLSLLKVFMEIADAGFFLEDHEFIHDLISERINKYTKLELNKVAISPQVLKDAIAWLNVREEKANKGKTTLRSINKYVESKTKNLKLSKEIIEIHKEGAKDAYIKGKIIQEIIEESEFFKEMYELGYMDTFLANGKKLDYEIGLSVDKHIKKGLIKS